MFNLLIIESDLSYATQIKEKIDTLKNVGMEAESMHTPSLEEALLLLNDKKFDLIITNLFLKDASGSEIIVKLNEKPIAVPILLCGENINDTLAQAAIHAGAQDFFEINKIEAQSLARLIRYSIERQILIESLRALTFTDELTGIYNRRGFMTLAEQQIEISLRTNRNFTLFVIDIDYLKLINDTHGHQAGDQALIKVSQVLKNNFRRYDIVSRIGGDEFAVLAIDLSESMVQMMKEKIKKQINSNSDQPYKLSLSIGAAHYNPKNNISFEELFQFADEDLYKAKQINHLSD